MELSTFSLLDGDPGSEGAARDRIRGFLELAAVSDRAGLRGLWVAEHHAMSGGGCPAPAVLLAAASQATRRIRLGPMVCVLPFHDPRLVAEEYGLVDAVSGGRLRMGVGSGYLPSEFELFGIDPADKRERFDAALAQLRSIWAEDPRRGGPVTTAGNPAVPRRPPEIWVAVQSPEAVEHVAARGDSAAVFPCASAGDLGELAALVGAFRRRRAPGSPAAIAAAVYIYAGDRRDQARTALQRHLDGRPATHEPFLKGRQRVRPRRVLGRALEERGFALIGGIESIANGLEAYRKMGIDEILAIWDFGGLGPREVRHSVERVAKLFPSDPAPSASQSDRALGPAVSTAGRASGELVVPA